MLSMHFPIEIVQKLKNSARILFLKIQTECEFDFKKLFSDVVCFQFLNFHFRLKYFSSGRTTV